MKKYTLIKFFKGEASEEEIDSIIKWVEKSPENKSYFANQKKLYSALEISSNIEKERLPKEEKRSHRVGRIILRVSAIAAACALFFTTGYYLNNLPLNSKDIITISEKNPNSMHELYTERGVKGFIVLPDSSKVWLNSDSKITYPETFEKDYRAVTLVGEAYFEVTKDSLRPMIVSTQRDLSIEVLGTSFNIKSYNNDDQIETTLYSGVIKAHFKNNVNSKVESITLKPNESFTYDDSSTSNYRITKKYKPVYNPKADDLKAWKDGVLIFDKTPMTEVIKMLERWHGTTFIIKNSKIYNYQLSAEFSSESIVQILEIMKMIMPLDYNYKNNIVTLK